MFSEVANSVAWIFTSKPASRVIACTTSAERCASLVVGVISVKLGLGTPASFSSALAFAMSRLARHVSSRSRSCRRDPLVADRRLVVHHHLRQALAVERELEGLAHARVACRARVLRLSLLPTLIVMPW
jgi:hypothetical protein